MLTLNLIEKLKLARRASVPLIGIGTADPMNCIRLVSKVQKEGSPIVAWDLIRGTWAVGNDEASDALASDLKEASAGNPVGLLEAYDRIPEQTIVFFLGADDFIEQAPVKQAIWNLRDEFKRDRRSLILLAPSIKLPIALKDDVVMFEEPLPSEEELEALIRELDSTTPPAKGQTARKPLSDVKVRRAVEASTGISAFAAETSISMALRPDGIDLELLLEQKRQKIGQVPGLSAEAGTETFADIGGLKQAKEFGTRLFEGKKPPRCVVRMEELEKAMGGSQGDTSGTSQDALQVMLSAMEDYGWAGMIAYGPAGSGKSLFSKSLANTFGSLPLVLDVNATKNSLVGSSEQQIRAAVKTLVSLGGRDAFFVASANSLSTLRPELKRRFRYGIWMFDLPDAVERQNIWSICRKKYSIADSDKGVGDDTDWSGADIRNCCELADRFGCSLREALPFLTQSGKSDPESVRSIREAAAGRFLSSSYAGTYQMPGKASKLNSTGRRALLSE